MHTLAARSLARFLEADLPDAKPTKWPSAYKHLRRAANVVLIEFLCDACPDLSKSTLTLVVASNLLQLLPGAVHEGTVDFQIFGAYKLEPPNRRSQATQNKRRSTNIHSASRHPRLYPVNSFRFDPQQEALQLLSDTAVSPP
eukprot:2836047-Amphidinium_carterae.2